MTYLSNFIDVLHELELRVSRGGVTPKALGSMYYDLNHMTIERKMKIIRSKI